MTIGLTKSDERLLAALPVLPDAALDKLIAHVTVRAPMCITYGWEESDRMEVAEDGTALMGCLAGVSMTYEEFGAATDGWNLGHPLMRLADDIFPVWAEDATEYLGLGGADELPKSVVDHLATLLEIEYTRRWPEKSAVQWAEAIAEDSIEVKVGSRGARLFDNDAILANPELVTELCDVLHCNRHEVIDTIDSEVEKFKDLNSRYRGLTGKDYWEDTPSASWMAEL